MLAVGNAHTGIPEGPQVLSGVKGETTDVTQRPDVLTLVVGSMCLGAVFNDSQVMLAGDRHDFVHGRRVPKQVDRYNGFSPVGD